MPHTVAYNFASGEIRMRWKEPYLTEGLNQRGLGTIPPGVYRGYRLAPSVGLLSVTVEADGTTNDHVAAVELSNGYVLTLYRAGGAFTLDLTAFANKTVVLVLYGKYVPGVATTAEIRVYELDPTDDFTGDPELGFFTVLGTVVVPGAGVIPASNIRSTYRTSAWQKQAQEARAWKPLLANARFADGPEGIILNPANLPHWLVALDNPTHLELLAGGGLDGGNALYFDADTVAVPWQASISQPVHQPVRPGQLLRWRIAYKVDGVPSAGSLIFQARFTDGETPPFGGSIPVLHTLDLSAVTPDYVVVEGFLEVPAGMRHFVGVDLATDPTVTWALMTDALLIGEMQVWLDAGPEELVDPRFRALYPTLLSWRERRLGVFEEYNPDRETLQFLEVSPDDIFLSTVRTDGSGTANAQPGYLAQGSMVAGLSLRNGTGQHARPRFGAYYDQAVDYVSLFEAIPVGSVVTIPLRVYQRSTQSLGAEGGFAHFVMGARQDASSPFDWERTNGVTNASRLSIGGTQTTPFLSYAWLSADGPDSTWVSVLNVFPEHPTYSKPRLQFTGYGSFGSDMVGAGENEFPRLLLQMPATFTVLDQGEGAFAIKPRRLGDALGRTFIGYNVFPNAGQFDRDSNLQNSNLFMFDGSGFTVYLRQSADAAPWAFGGFLHGNVNAGIVFLRGDSDPSLGKRPRVEFAEFDELDATDTAEPNALYAKNVVKAWAHVTTGVGGPTLRDGFAIASVAYGGVHLEIVLQNPILGAPKCPCIQVTAYAFSGTPAVYTAQVNPAGDTIIISGTTLGGGSVDFTVVSHRLMISVLGRTLWYVFVCKLR